MKSFPGTSTVQTKSLFIHTVLVLVLAWFSAAPGKAQQNLPPELISYPQLILYNGKVLTADDRFTIAEAVAIRDDKFLAVGTTDRILKMAGPRTRQVDLKRKSVVPGFIDTHQHLPNFVTRGYYMERKDVQWDGEISPAGQTLILESPEHLLHNIKKIIEVTPPGKLVVLYGSSDTVSAATSDLRRSQLDAVSPNHPVAIMAASGSADAANTLELMKFPKNFSGYPQDDDVAVSGRVAEMILLDVLWNIPQEELITKFKEKMLEYSANSGLTTIASRIYPNELSALRELWAKGELTVRFRLNANTFVPPGENPEMAYKRMGNITDFGDDWVRISGMGGGATDSSGQSGGAWTSFRRLRDDFGSIYPGLKVPYGSYGTRGLEDRWAGKENVVQMVRYGWSIANTHTVGDRGTTVYLDTYEEALKDPVFRNSNQRLTLDHLLMVRPEDIPRFKRLGVYPSIAPWFLFMPPNTDILVHLYGEERVDTMMPVKSYILAGIKPGAEADVDGRPYRDPLWTIEKLVTRKDEKGRVWNAKEKVTREEALWMYTNWSAYQRGDEKTLGIIEPGRLADLVVLDGDYMTVPEDDISDLPLVMTIVGGKIAYEKPGLF